MTKKDKDNYKIWMVRAGSGSYLLEDFLKEDIVAIGWNDLGKIENINTYNELKDKIISVYPDSSSGSLGQTTGQIWRFYNDFSVGDKVITYDSKSRVYYLGTITSDYDFNTQYEYNHYRKVEWLDGVVSRDRLQIDTKNTLGSVLTIFELSIDIWNEMISFHPGFISDEELEEIEQVTQQKEKQEALESLKEDAIAKSTEFIKDIVYNLNWEDMENLVAGILRGMGYKTRLTNRGADLGHDIIASTDGLEMVEPIIKVEVKHRIQSKNKIGAPELRNFIGGLRNPIRGIYVSTTGFSKDAFYESERANFQITLVDLDRLVDLIVEYYELLDIETKALVPLRKIYWPIK